MIPARFFASLTQTIQAQSGRPCLRCGYGAVSDGYGLMLLIVFITSTVLIGTSMQLVLGSGAASYMGTLSQDNISARQAAISGMETVLSDIQTKLNQGTVITTAYTYSSGAITMPNDPASLGGGTTQIGSYSATMTAARGNTFLINVVGVVGSATYSYSRLVYMSRTNNLLDSMTGANAAYSLRKLTSSSTYNGPAIRIRRSSDNTEQDIGFDGNGNLDIGSLRTFLSTTTPPVDSVGSAAAAFGIRKLRSAYTGYAMNVRRSSDSTTMDIGFTATGDLDTAALLGFVGSGTGYVAKWYDQSGNGNDAAQATTTSQPTIVTAGVLNMVNNRPAILYDGTDDSLRFNRTISDDFTMMACYSVITGYRAASGYPNWFNHAGIVDGEVGGTVNDFGISVDTAGSTYVGVGNPDTTILSPANGYNDNRMHWVAMTRTKSSGYFSLFQDAFSYAGPDSSTPNTSSLTAATQLSIGRLQGGSACPLNGYVNEVLVYGSTLSASNRNLIKLNESWYFNMYRPWAAWTRPLNAISSIPANTLAYSLRKLNTAYNYNAIQVRRSSDNAVQNIGWDTTTGSLDVISLLSFVGSGSGYVKTMYDQSGTGKDLTQSTAAYQPRIVNAGVLDTVNGKPAIYFDGVDDYLPNTGLTANTGNKVSALVYGSQPSYQATYARLLSVYANGRYDYDNDTSASLIQVNNDNSRTLQTERNSASSGRLTTTATFEYGTPFLGTSIFDGTNGYLYLNGFRGASYAYNAAFNYTNIMLGNSPTSDYFRGYITEAFLFPTALSDADRLVLQQNILSYYAPPLATAHVSKWYDQSGNGRNMAQTEPMLQPSLIMPPYGTANSTPMLMFNGSQYLWNSTGMPTNADYSKVAVFSYFDSTQANNIISGNLGNSHAFYMNNSNYICLFQYSGCYATSTLPMTGNTLYAASGTYTETTPSTRTGYVYRSNTQGGTGSTGHANGSDTSLSLGAYGGGASGLYGTISEAMVFARSLSAADRTTIYNDERGYFGSQ